MSLDSFLDLIEADPSQDEGFEHEALRYCHRIFASFEGVTSVDHLQQSLLLVARVPVAHVVSEFEGSEEDLLRAYFLGCSGFVNSLAKLLQHMELKGIGVGRLTDVMRHAFSSPVRVS